MKRILEALAVVFLAACSSTPAQTSAPASAPGTPAVNTDLIVFAAASLNKALPEIQEAKYSFDGSAALVDQLKGGAPADVFVSADKSNMDKAEAAGVIDGAPVQFASNVLVLVTPAGNPAKITGLDASLDGKKLVICAEGVPCGNATVKLSKEVGITLKPVSEETKVTDVLGKVTSGEADAGVVYATDAKGAGDKVETIQVPGSEKLPNTYWVAVVKGTKNAEAAKAFVDTLAGEEGRKVLEKYGFGPAL